MSTTIIIVNNLADSLSYVTSSSRLTAGAWKGGPPSEIPGGGKETKLVITGDATEGVLEFREDKSGKSFFINFSCGVYDDNSTNADSDEEFDVVASKYAEKGPMTVTYTVNKGEVEE